MRDLTVVKSQLQDGDIIFTRIANFLYRRVAETQNSWESHVGIVLHDPDKGWIVAESCVPFSKYSSLEKFIARSENGRFEIRRIAEGLTPTQKENIKQSASTRIGILYHLGFNYDSDRMFCSKFVYDVYRSATDKTIGKIISFRDLLSHNASAPLWFWRLWFFGCIPFDRRCVTTTSQLNDTQLVTVFNSEVNKTNKRDSNH